MLVDTVGFLGLGIMGGPMATRLAAAGTPLAVWSRTASHCHDACHAGAYRADTQDEVFHRCRIVIMMLANEQAIDEVLGRGSTQFDRRVEGHVVVHMGTTMPEHAVQLSADIAAAGGTYVEAPVSGSKVPAERGELVSMLAGPAEAIGEVADILRPMCQNVFPCGTHPGAALRMKLAVNLYLVTTVVGLAEAAHFAERQGLNLDTFVSIINAGQLASPVAGIKGAKLRDRDFSVQAAIHDVRKNSRFVVEAAEAAGIATPMARLADRLYQEALQLGFGHDDMAAVVRAIEARTEAWESTHGAAVDPVGEVVE